MAFTNTSYRYQFGVELSEGGLNKVSKSLRQKKPELFSKKSDIPIKKATSTSPEHILTLVAMVSKESVVFDIHPLSDANLGKKDSISVTVSMDFSLTDSVLGFITRLGIDIKATVSVIRTDRLQILLEEFKILKITGKHPDFAMQLINNKLDATKQINATYKFSSSSDKSLAESLTALVNYLIDLFLKDALTRAIVEFPVPDLASLIKFGRLSFGRDELRGPFLRNNGFYTMLGADLGVPTAFPSAFTPMKDLRVGISESGLERVAKGILPLRIPDADITKPYNTFYVHAKNVQIEKASFDIRPSDNTLGTSLFFSGLLQINIRFDVPVINKRVDIPIPIPFDKLSHYRGLIEPYLVVDSITDPDPKVHVHLKPHAKFLDAWYLFVLTDYRGLIERAIREWVDRFKDNFIVRFFRKIPIIGWILDKVMDMTGWIIGFAIGSVLDIAVSTTLNLLINVIGRLILQFFFTPDFAVYEIEQKPLREATGLTIGKGQIAMVPDGRGGEMELRFDFDTPIATVRPAIQLDALPAPNIEPKPAPEIPGMTRQREYKEGEYSPLTVLPIPVFQAGGERFSITSKVDDKMYMGFLSLNYYQQEENWIVQKSFDIEGEGIETAKLSYQKDFKPLSMEIANSSSTGSTFRLSAENNLGVGTIAVNAQLTAESKAEQSTTYFEKVPLEFSDFWIYRLAHTDTTAIKPGKFSRLSVDSYFQYLNWVRIIPMEIKSVKDITIELPSTGNDKPPVKLAAVNVVCQDEDGSYELIILKAGGLYAATLNAAGVVIQIKSIL